MRLLPLLATALLATEVLAGCAAAPAKPTPGDPFERLNRGTHAFNRAVDHAVLRPAARGYQYFLPRFARTGIHNALSNLGLPVVFVNDVLQVKPRAAGQDFLRLFVNSIFGLGGLLDPASDVGLTRNDEDFGQTLGRWGVPSGPYLELPFFGPSTLRDAPMLIPELLLDPRAAAFPDRTLRYPLAVLTFVERRSELLSTDKALDESFDPYAFIRNAWLQRREYLVHDGAPPEEVEPLEDPGEDEPADQGGTTEPPPAAPPPQ